MAKVRVTAKDARGAIRRWYQAIIDGDGEYSHAKFLAEMELQAIGKKLTERRARKPAALAQPKDPA